MVALKLDENLSDRLLHIARDRGYDAESVRTEKLNGASDSVLFEHCLNEGRSLITLDLDFSNPFRFSPSSDSGTIVLRPQRPGHAEITALFETALDQLAKEEIKGRIWIVEPGRLRIYRDSERG